MENRTYLAPDFVGRRPERRKKSGLVRPRHTHLVLRADAPASVNLDPLRVAVEGSGLEFFAFDSSYVEKLRSGDTHVEGHFVTYFSELIRLKLRSRLHSQEAIEDVRQETFLRVLALLRAEAGIRQPDRLGPFVNSVCNHVLMEHYRAQKRVPTPMDDETAASVASSQPNALSLLEVKDTERVVRQILKELTDRDRRLLQAVLLDELDKDQVCAEFGISRDYLRVLLHRAKQSFKSFYISRLGQ